MFRIFDDITSHFVNKVYLHKLLEVKLSHDNSLLVLIISFEFEISICDNYKLRFLHFFIEILSLEEHKFVEGRHLQIKFVLFPVNLDILKLLVDRFDLHYALWYLQSFFVGMKHILMLQKSFPEKQDICWYLIYFLFKLRLKVVRSQQVLKIDSDDIIKLLVLGNYTVKEA